MMARNRDRKRKNQGPNIFFKAMILVTEVPPSRPCPMAPWARDQAFHQSIFGGYSRSGLQRMGIIEKHNICDTINATNTIKNV